MKQGKDARIKEAMKQLGLLKADTFSIKELDDIARLAKVQRIDVMFFARYGKR